MNDGSINSISNSALGRAVGQHNLDSLLSQFEGRWGKAVKLIEKLSEENSFLQDQLRDLEEKLGTLEKQLQDTNQRLR